MPEIRKRYDREFRDGAVRIVEETNKPIAQVARDLGVNEGTLGNWVAKAREAREGTDGLSTGDIEELKRLRAENAELRMERDVLKRSVVLWVKEATKLAWPASSPTRGPTTGCRTRSPAPCWAYRSPGSTSGWTGLRRRPSSGAPRSTPRSPTPSARRAGCTARPGCTPTCARPAGQSRRRRSPTRCAARASSPARSDAARGSRGRTRPRR